VRAAGPSATAAAATARETFIAASFCQHPGEPTPPNIARLFRLGPEAFILPEVRTLAGSVGSGLNGTIPDAVAIMASLPANSTGILGMFLNAPALPLDVAEVEAGTVLADWTARKTAQLIWNANEQAHANPGDAPAIGAALAAGLAQLRAELPTLATLARPLSALVHHADNDPAELLRHRFLCQGGGLLLVGPTGIGKSSLLLQGMILWALGKAAFGIEPARPLKSVLIQAENDDGDLAEMRDGVIAGLGLTPTEAEQAQERVFTHREDVKSGPAFFAGTVAPLLEAHKPDLLGIDPALAYIGGDAASQKDVGAFLRNGLNPLLHRHSCGAIIAHHTNKPPTGNQKPDWKASDFAYLGTGSAEWCNWARGVLAVRSIGSHDVFELQAGKRGARLQWADADGQRVYSRHLAHSKHGICWLEAEPDQIPKAGRPREVAAEEVLSLLPDGGLTATEWQKEAKTELGVSESAWHRARRELEATKRILKSKGSRKWMPIQP